MGHDHVRRFPRTLITLAVAISVSACGDNLLPEPSVVVHRPAELAAGTTIAVADLVADLSRLTGTVVAEAGLPAPPCREHELHVVVLGHEHDGFGQPTTSDLDEQAYEISEIRCQDGHVVTVRGGSHLASQWAIYDFLERLGVRYFHPEQTYYSPQPRWPDEPISVRESPTFRRRSMHVHVTHPVELSPPIAFGGIDVADYQRRWIDWNVKLRQTMVDGWDLDFAGPYAFERGFPRSTGLNLLNSQQGGRPVLDPHDPRPESAQLAEAIDEAMAPQDDLPEPAHFGFQFNPTEFTTADERKTVERITFVTDYVTSHWPNVKVWTINHGTAQTPGPVYGVRFFDLPQLGPPALGVQVHPLMFYDLHRPAAGIYGNADFRHLYDWLVEQQARRRVVYYPEGSWWLTFDLPVPLYLAPATIEARDFDIQRLVPYASTEDDAATGVYGHHLFTSGQEWGYWMIDYCTAQLAWRAELGWQGCIDRVVSALARPDVLGRVLREVTARQIEDLRDPDRLRMMVGSDDETEAAADAGIVFHPLPPRPSELLTWSDDQAAALRARSLEPLRAMAADYAAWAAAVEAVLPAQSADQAPWVREIRDGLRIMGLRAEHAVRVYETALDVRAAVIAGDLAAIDRAAGGLVEARRITEDAAAIVTAREQDYRYVPELQTDGDEPGSRGAVPNRTIYPYRVLSRTHRLHYWRRPDAQLAALFGEGLSRVSVNLRILEQGTALDVRVLADEIRRLTITWGDGEVNAALAPHTYAAQGFYPWSLDVVHQGGVISHDDLAVVVERRLVFPRGSLSVVAPTGAEIVGKLLPGFEIGLGADSRGSFLALGRLDGSATVSAQGSLLRRDRRGSTSGPADLRLTLGDVGDITVFGATITVDEHADPALTITGELSTDEVIQRLVEVGGFDRVGARRLVASILGYSDDNLPARVSFTVSGKQAAAPG